MKISRILSGLIVGLACLMMGTTGSAAATTNAQAPAPAFRMGFHINGGSTATMEAAAAAGSDFVVVVFSWRDIEPVQGYNYWEVPDAAVRAAEFHGLEILARLDRPPEWAQDEAGPTPWRLNDYANFVGRVTDRYGDRLAGVIIWNEPNLALEWAGELPDPAGYAQMLQQAYTAVKTRSPGLPVAAAGLAMTLGDGTTAVDDLSFLEAMLDAGATDSFDILAVHAYGFGAPPGDNPDESKLNIRRLELQQARLDAAGLTDIPLWITESGWRTSAPDPADAWQIVSPTEQADYTLALVEQAARNKRIARLGFWELTTGSDGYGYALWQQGRPPTLAYNQLAARAVAGPTGHIPDPDAREEIEILAPDAIVRLGDIGTLHPHWVHLHRGGENVSPDWRGEFFLTGVEADRSYDLLLETMQVDQPTNAVEINGTAIGLLSPRPRPDPTSTWVTQRLTVPADLLRSGLNHVKIRSSLRNPVRQYSYWRLENLQFRNMRLAHESQPPPERFDWVAQPAPGGWAEINRIRREAGTTALWITGNRIGQLWRTEVTPDGLSPLVDRAGNLTDCTFNDLRVGEKSQIAATSCGLFHREEEAEQWQRAAGVGRRHAYVIARSGDRLLAGFEGRGLWQAATAAGPWRFAGLAGHSVFDIVALADDNTAIATSQGVYMGPIDALQRLSAYPAGAGTAPDGYTVRLALDRDSRLLARYRDQIWRWDEGAGWEPVGPPDVRERVMAVADCCGEGALAGTDRRGLRQLAATGSWEPVDNGRLRDLKVTALERIANLLVLGTDNGLFWTRVDHGDDLVLRRAWGLPTTVTALLRHPIDPSVLVAATPAGIARSHDGGASWQDVSPPWVVWDMAFGPGGRLYAARADGLAWSDDVLTDSPGWTESEGMETVTFFTAVPDRAAPNRLLAGTWGNGIGVSEDGGASISSLGNGLETLSVLDIFQHATPGQMTIGTIEGLYRSDDDGESWFKLPGALERQTVYVVRQTARGLLLAGVGDGLWQSADYGQSWHRFDTIPQSPVIRLGDVPAVGELLWAGTEGAGLWISQDGGESWQWAGLSGRTVYDVLVGQQGYLTAATDAGIYAARVDPALGN